MRANVHLIPVTQFRSLRRVLAPEYSTLPSLELAAIMERRFGAGSAEYYDEYVEGIFDDVGRFFSRNAPGIARIGGGIAQGALAGSALGLPGIIAGAAAGGAGAGLSHYGRGPVRDVGQALSGVTNIAGQFSPAGQVGNMIGSGISGLAGGRGPSTPRGGSAILSGASTQTARLGSSGQSAARSPVNPATTTFGGSGAAGQLLSLLQRPEVLQALSSMVLGSAGRGTVAVGSSQTPVPVGAIANLIGTLANQAAAEASIHSDGAERALEYMMDESGEFVGDPSLDRDRAARLWELLNAAQVNRVIAALGRQAHLLEAEECAEAQAIQWARESEMYSEMPFDQEDYSAEDILEDVLEIDGETDAEDLMEWEER